MQIQKKKKSKPSSPNGKTNEKIKRKEKLRDERDL